VSSRRSRQRTWQVAAHGVASEQQACRSTGAKVHEVADSPSIGGGHWYVLPDGSTYFRPTDGELRQSLITAHTLRDRPTWTEVAAAETS